MNNLTNVFFIVVSSLLIASTIRLASLTLELRNHPEVKFRSACEIVGGKVTVNPSDLNQFSMICTKVSQ